MEANIVRETCEGIPVETTNVALMRRTLLAGERNRATSDVFDLHAELAGLAAPLGLDLRSGGGKFVFDRLDPLMNTRIRMGAVAALPLALQSLAAAYIWRERTGLGQDVTIDLGQAIVRLAPMTSLRYELLNGNPPDWMERFPYFNFYRTSDGRHGMPLNFYPGIKSRMFNVLDCAPNPDALAAAIRRRTADELEQLAEENGFVFAAVRSVEEFTQTDAFEYLAALPLIEIEKVGDSDPEPFSPDPIQPLSGIRALGMGHVVAGAGTGRSLAALGADVLNVWRVMEWEHDLVYASTNVGTRSTRLDVNSDAGRRVFLNLLRDADVFFANRRPALLRRFGVDLDQAIEQRPGLVHVTVSTHGSAGPWGNRIGFDQVAGAVSGMFVVEGSADEPALPPTGIVNDYVCAWLATTGAMVALARRAREGGSYRVHVSLTRAAMWALSLGCFDPDFAREAPGSSESHTLIAPQLFTSMTPLGLYQGVTENVLMSRTPYHYTNVLSARGADQPIWLPKYPPVDVAGLREVLARTPWK